MTNIAGIAIVAGIALVGGYILTKLLHLPKLGHWGERLATGQRGNGKYQYEIVDTPLERLRMALETRGLTGVHDSSKSDWLANGGEI